MEAMVLIADAGPVRTLTLNRPERRNALTPQMQAELMEAFAAAETAANVRVIVLTGAGQAFCAGLDLSALEAMQGKSAAELDADGARVASMFAAVHGCTKPTIAAVNGHAIAGGTGLATLCDFTLAVPSAEFAYTEVRIGFVPALVSAYLVLQVGEKIARDLLLTGRLFTADEAARLGLVTEVVEAEQLVARTSALAATLVENSSSSLRATKALLLAQQRLWLEQALEAAVRANVEIRRTADFSEGVRAFLEKRKPRWQ